MREITALALALSFMALLGMAADADARGKRRDDPPRPPECQVEDGGVLVCH